MLFCHLWSVIDKLKQRSITHTHWPSHWVQCDVSCLLEDLSVVCSNNSAIDRVRRLQPVSVWLLPGWHHRGQWTELRWMPAERRYPSRILCRDRVWMLSWWSDCRTRTLWPRLSKRSVLRMYSSLDSASVLITIVSLSVHYRCQFSFSRPIFPDQFHNEVLYNQNLRL